MMNEICLVTKNSYKIQEFRTLFLATPLRAVELSFDIREIQTEDIETIIRDKVIKAFSFARRPVIVDHSGLSLVALGGFPRGLTQLFWDTVRGDRICDIVKALGDDTATAITWLGFCDGKKIYACYSQLEGAIAEKPAGTRDFQWDRIFIPKGYDRTYAEMDIEEKNRLSQRAKALEKLLDILKRDSLLPIT